MLLLSLLVGCRTVELGVVLVAPEDLAVRQAYDRIKRLRLRDCDGAVTREWVGQRLDLLATVPQVVRDREWCGVDIEFKEAPLLGPPLGWRGETIDGTGFDVALSPGTVSVDGAFGGSGTSQVIVLDLGAVMTAGELNAAADETSPPLEEIVYTEGSAWSQEHLPLLDSALSVEPLPQARARAGWPHGAFALPADEPSGCAAHREDSAAWWGDTAADDTGIGTDAPPPSSGGCSGDGDDTSSDDTGEEEEEEEDTGTDSGGGCQDGDSDDSGAGAVQQRLGLVALLALVGLRRRRGGRAGPDPR